MEEEGHMQVLLTHFVPLPLFLYPQKTPGFLIFLGVTEIEYGYEIG